tara:strand:+ start:11908 stop:13722 length:1815 start_codon:yes stop_codon:yes gene_type:complete
MAINRYTQAPVAQYNPMSMEELAFAPTFLRQRHDATAQGLSDLQTASNQYDVLDPYRMVANQIVDPLQKGINSTAEELANKGINQSGAVQQAMKLKSQYTEAFGPNGAIGQLQGATKSYRARAEELKKQNEDNPTLQRYALSQLRPGEATYKDGKLELGNMTDAQMVRHINEEDILDRLNKAVGGLKESDLSRSGIQYNGKLGSFNDLYSIAQTQGVSQSRVNELISGLLSNEEILSIDQMNKAQGLDPKAGMNNFLQKVQGIADANVTSKTNYRDFNISDEMAIHAAKKYADAEPNSFEYDPYTKVVKPGTLDNSYFEPNQVELKAESGKLAMPYTLPLSQTTVKGYKPFSKEQEPIVKEILAEKLGIPVDRITGFDLNKKENRDILKRYHEANKGNIRITPKIENASLLREYGGKPEAASKDLMDAYSSKQFIDAETRQPLSTEEIGELIGSGHKLNVMGIYGSGSGFTADAKANGINALAMTRPMAVNIVNAEGQIIKRVAASRQASYYEGFGAFETSQQDLIIDEVIQTPNVTRVVPYTITRNANGQPIQGVNSINITVKYNPSSGSYEIGSKNNDFNTFKILDMNDLNMGILSNIEKEK